MNDSSKLPNDVPCLEVMFETPESTMCLSVSASLFLLPEEVADHRTVVCPDTELGIHRASDMDDPTGPVWELTLVILQPPLFVVV